MSAITSPRLAAVLSRENFVLRDDLQQDKRAALRAVVRMFTDFNIPYVITGGLAVQLYNSGMRPTVDVDVVSLRDPFERLKESDPWRTYGFELVFDHCRHIKLKHLEGNVEVDINVDTRFARLVEDPIVEWIDGLEVRFCSPFKLALAKLRTQRSDWPRSPVKRRQDYLDLLGLLAVHPEIADPLRTDPLTTDEMRQVLDMALNELRTGTGDDLPDESVPG
ncbi:MAG TPA: hypothetical protein PKG54_10280 [Phycisphaerae bacterium]|nr:hypothetical protein [Phycisphaerae bacterium]HOJ53763.1 hypothetical protein [Phycisphaerae bacterium]HOL27305.1 hypothetical protein [Phycisphaerae bacterium]HPP21445.1 hypothetical protein [Phycisphaerae bacterium]HPU31641.1 hypothetical protein [Phycisphaerae bacterium]